MFKLNLMKKQILLLSFLSFIMLSAHSSDKKEKVEIDMFQLLEGQYYTFEASSITSQKGFNRTLTSNYFLTVNGDSAMAYLPFVGRSYGGAYGGDGAIEFDNLMKEYTSELKVKKKEKNNQTLIMIEVVGEKDIYTCNLSVSKSGNASLTVISNNRQTVSFGGNVVPIEEE